MNKHIKEYKQDKVKVATSMVLFLILLIGATYAIMGIVANYDSTRVGTNLGSRPVFVADTNDQIILDIPYIPVTSAEVYAISMDTAAVNLSLSANYDTSCSYDLYWTWDGSEDSYVKTEGAEKEFTISGSINNEEVFSEVQVESSSKTKLYSGSIFTEASKLTNQTIIINAEFWKTKEIQEGHAGKSYQGKVSVENVLCEGINSSLISNMPNRELSYHILNKSSDEELISSQDDSIYVIKQESVTHEGTTYDAGVRYEGKDPDNYIEFNNEIWRIIGVFEGSTIGLEPGKYYTKILKETSIGTYSWDKGTIENNRDTIYTAGESENDWSNASLNTYLNGEYLRLIRDQNKIARYNGSYSTWYLNGPTVSQLESAHTVADSYLYERILGGPGSYQGVINSAEETIQSAIGLMYPSDYGYAAYGDGCSRNQFLHKYHRSADSQETTGISCESVDWIAEHDNTEWLLTPLLSSDYFFLALAVGGEIGSGYVSNAVVDTEIAVRPSLYLEDSVLIMSGTGAKDNPYKLIDNDYDTLSNTVLSQQNNLEYKSAQDGSGYVVTKEEVEYNGTTYDAGVRYEGKNPDNYVRFNGNEEWRIIGVFEGSTIGLEPGKQYTKIIMPEGLYRPWDCMSYDEEQAVCNANDAEENDWVNSDVNEYLNTTFLDGMVDANKIAKYNDNYSTWHLRGTTYENRENAFASDFYLYERFTGEAAYRNEVLGDADETTKSAIALMYPSDYGYAAYGKGCYKDQKLHEYDKLESTNTCASVDWLNLSESPFWLLSPIIDDYYYAVKVNNGKLTDGAVDSDYYIHPTLYLEHDIKVISGSGSKNNPYILE